MSRHSNSVPWMVAGAGAFGLGFVLFLMFQKKTPLLPSKKLSPEEQNKVNARIAASKDPVFLLQLATGLQKSGASSEAMAAVTKAAQLTGKPQSVPGALGMPPITVSPSASSAGPSTYQVVSGDIPGAIAKRFGVSLSSLAKVNGANQKRIMGGQIKVGETLQLPVGVIDSGPANHAKGLAS